jgi:hypothetical protein
VASRPAKVANGGGNTPGLAAATAGTALAPVAGTIEETWLNAGAAEVQPCGTDSTPRVAARPTLAVIAALPIPAELTALEPTPLPNVDPHACRPLVRTLAAGLIDFISALAEPSNARLEPDIDELVPEAMPVAEPSAVAAVDDELTPETVELVVDDDVADAVEATPDAVSGATAAVLSGVDTA